MMNPLTETAPPGSSPADKRYNFAACLIDATAWPLGSAFFSTVTLIPVFMQHLGAGNTAIGFLVSLINLLIFLPGFLVAQKISRLPRASRWLFWLAFLERLFFLPLVPLTLLWGITHPDWLLGAVFFCFIGNSVAMGFNQPAYWVVIGKSVPAVWRGRLFGFAGGVSGVLGFGIDRWLRSALSGPNGGFPEGYSHAFLFGFVILTVGILPFVGIREPISPPPDPGDARPRNYVQECLHVWRTQTGFRRFLIAQVLYTLIALASPFYILYAQHTLHAPITAIAGYTATMIYAPSFATLLWGAWADRSGNKIVLLASISMALLGAVLAVCVHSSLLFYGVFVALALATAGVGIAGFNIVMEFAPEARDIPLYTTMYNAVTALPRAAAPLLGGVIADSVGGYHLVFLLSGALAIVSWVLTLRVIEPRKAIPRSAAHEGIEGF